MDDYGHELVVRAICFAAEKHKGQPRKKKTIPFIVHPMEAAAIVSSMTDDPEVIAAAVLHDVLEDTPTSKEELTREFGRRICDLVAEESEDKRPDQPPEETWQPRKQETIDKLAHAGRDTKILTLADKLANIREMKRDYSKIGEQLWENFNQNDPAKQAWYYRSVLSALESLSDQEAYKEFKVLVETFLQNIKDNSNHYMTRS